ncbi:MAG TPA: acyltransferase [Thermoleophilaceae bacterium]|nr:acyltransferase [Thermoleophilaceae bacterium]
MEATAARAPAPPAFQPPPGNPRFPLIDGLRAIAALSIVAFHAGHLTGSDLTWWGAYVSRLDVGVTIFFVVSGFLLYRPFVAARLEGRPRPGIPQYAARRALRIVPAYWVAITLLAVYPGISGIFTGDWWIYYGLLQTYFGEHVLGGIQVAWTLVVEVSFYAVLPLLALALTLPAAGRTRAGRLRAELALLALLFAIPWTLRIVTAAEGDTPKRIVHLALSGSLDWFAWGMALAVASVALHGRERSVAAIRLVHDHAWICWAAAAAMLVVMVELLDFRYAQLEPTDWLWHHLLYGLLAVALVLPAVFGTAGQGVVRRILGHPVAAWLGLVSYGIFLYHLPVVGELAGGAVGEWAGRYGFPVVLGLAAPIAIALGAASYYAVERPFLRLKPGVRVNGPRRADRAPGPDPAPAGAPPRQG